MEQQQSFRDTILQLHSCVVHRVHEVEQGCVGCPYDFLFRYPASLDLREHNSPLPPSISTPCLLAANIVIACDGGQPLVFEPSYQGMRSSHALGSSEAVRSGRLLTHPCDKIQTVCQRHPKVACRTQSFAGLPPQHQHCQAKQFDLHLVAHRVHTDETPHCQSMYACR